MKVVCSQSELNAALQLVSRAVATRPTHPVLANVLLTADAGSNRLSLTGFDLNLGIQTSLGASVETSGAITLPSRLLGEIVSRLASDSPITLATEESGEQVQLTSLSGSYQMRGMPADDYPELPVVESGMALKLAPAGLVQALKGTLFASSADEAKQLLTGVHLRFNDRTLEAAATDGHRLAVLQVEDVLDNDSESDDGPREEFAVTLPARSLREVDEKKYTPHFRQKSLPPKSTFTKGLPSRPNSEVTTITFISNSRFRNSPFAKPNLQTLFKNINYGLTFAGTVVHFYSKVNYFRQKRRAEA